MRGNYRNKKLLEVVRESECQHCGVEDGTVCAAHANTAAAGKGMGIKAHDFLVAALCFRCHMELDQGKNMTKDERAEMWQNAHNRTISWLFQSGKLKVC